MENRRERIWTNAGPDEGSRHVIGNGSMLVYGIGPNLEYLYGPPYSSPPFIGMALDVDGVTLTSSSVREPGTAIWCHRIDDEQGCAAQITDYMLPDRNVFVREIEAFRELRYRIGFASGGVRQSAAGSLLEEAPEASSLLLCYTKGPVFLPYDPVTEEVCLLITAQGSAAISGTEQAGGAAIVTLKAGKSKLLFASGTSYPSLLKDSGETLRAGSDPIERVRDYWKRFTQRRRDFAALIPANHPHRNVMLDAIDSVSVLIKCHQSRSGGVVPGHRYSPMAYVRDMAGVVRGLLALGYTEEVKEILLFWKAKWERFGNLQNAEGMGDDSVRLSGGNNEVEIPSYVLLCCFRYYEETGDEALLRELLPMLEWAFSVQLSHLVEGMTEFSFDETYIAGGVFPAHFIFQGSAESTLMFVTGGGKLLEWAERNGLIPEERLNSYQSRLEYARNQYRRNFMPDGVLYANHPLREKIAGKPRFLFGFCDAHGRFDGQLVNRWLELQEQGYYLCPECKGRTMPDFEADPEKRYELNSVNFIPLYIGSDLFTTKEIASIIKPGIDQFLRTGTVPSELNGTRSLGYDYGLMLYNAVKMNEPAKEKALGKVLGLLDSTGAWVEYYDNDRPADCCRARPWESGINIEGVIEYIKSLA